jgi:hypothetical protein
MVAFDEFMESLRLSIAGYSQLRAGQASDFSLSLSNILCGGCGMPNPKIKPSPAKEEQASVRRAHLPQDLGTPIVSNVNAAMISRKSQSGGIPLDSRSHWWYSPPMSTLPVLKNADFELVSEFAQPDAKKRLSLGEALGSATAFNIYRNPLGQLILDPVKAVPASEMWLYENAEALASVKQGLRESAEGKSVYRGSFAKHTRE